MGRRGHDPATGDLVMALARRVRRAHVEALAEWDVTPSQARALRVLAGADGMRPSALADALRIAPRSATEVVDALEERGWVRREPDPTDRRATRWCPPRTAGGWWSGSTTYAGRRRSGCSTCSRRPASYAPRDPDRRRGGGPVTVRVGLTGGVASGKSTVSAILAELGAVVIDADLIAREVVARGTPGLDAVVAEFGPELLTPDGDLDRPAMGALVFGDPDARRRLEAIIHPLVHARSAELEAAAAEHAVVVHDIPLLAEVGRAGSFDEVVVVDAPAELQVPRMVEDRGWTREDAESRIAAQATREERLAIATHVIDNTGTLADLRRQVEEIHAELARRA